MKSLTVFVTLLGLGLSQVLILEEAKNGGNEVVLDEKAAPWWEQEAELAKRRCQSSCTMHSKGVKEPQITLCDDTEVRILTLFISYHSVVEFLIYGQVCFGIFGLSF